MKITEAQRARYERRYAMERAIEGASQALRRFVEEWNAGVDAERERLREIRERIQAEDDRDEAAYRRWRAEEKKTDTQGGSTHG